MKNKIFTIPLFDSRYKRFVKKFPTLEEELLVLQELLLENPKMGILLTTNIYKIRVPNKDNQRGKSGGFRIITYLIEENQNNYEINLLTIYDKFEESTVSKSALLKIVKHYFKS
jgi:mRNA-degrading endonuclease RelE of RelBE toxin-antitoxin system